MKKDIHPINLTLLHILENQADRTHFALQGLDENTYTRAPGGDCNSIHDIGKHLVMLRGFQLLLLGSDLRKDMPDDQVDTVIELVSKLDKATALVRQAIETHDPADWHAEPTEPREGPWPELPTLIRLVRPMNDFANHLGGIRAIRRIMGNPAEQTQ